MRKLTENSHRKYRGPWWYMWHYSGIDITATEVNIIIVFGLGAFAFFAGSWLTWIVSSCIATALLWAVLFPSYGILRWILAPRGPWDDLVAYFPQCTKGDYETISTLHILETKTWVALTIEEKQDLARINGNSVLRETVKMDPATRQRLLRSVPSAILGCIRSSNLPLLAELDHGDFVRTMAAVPPQAVRSVFGNVLSRTELGTLVRATDTARARAFLESARPEAAEALDHALASGTVRLVEARGAGLETVTLVVEAKNVRLIVPLGMTFVASGNYQTMAARRDVSFDLGDSHVRWRLDVPVVCTEFHKAVPRSTDAFEKLATAGALLRKVMATALASEASPLTTQLATWFITDRIAPDHAMIHRPPSLRVGPTGRIDLGEDSRPTEFEKAHAWMIVFATIRWEGGE